MKVAQDNHDFVSQPINDPRDAASIISKWWALGYELITRLMDSVTVAQAKDGTKVYLVRNVLVFGRIGRFSQVAH